MKSKFSEGRREYEKPSVRVFEFCKGVQLLQTSSNIIYGEEDW